MNRRTLFHIISLVMLLAAVVFVLCAMACPTCGRTLYIGSIAIGADVWHACYTLYIAVMVGCFLFSFHYPKQLRR